MEVFLLKALAGWLIAGGFTFVCFCAVLLGIQGVVGLIRKSHQEEGASGILFLLLFCVLLVLWWPPLWLWIGGKTFDWFSGVD